MRKLKVGLLVLVMVCLLALLMSCGMRPSRPELPRSDSEAIANEWNTADLDTSSNGNVLLAVGLLQNEDGISGAMAASPGLVIAEPQNYYGQLIKLTGIVSAVTNYSPSSEMSALLEADRESAEMVITTDDGYIVKVLLRYNAGTISFGERVHVYGYVVGRLDNIETPTAGFALCLVLVSNVVERAQ